MAMTGTERQQRYYRRHRDPNTKTTRGPRPVCGPPAPAVTVERCRWCHKPVADCDGSIDRHPRPYHDAPFLKKIT